MCSTAMFCSLLVCVAVKLDTRHWTGEPTPCRIYNAAGPKQGPFLFESDSARAARNEGSVADWRRDGVAATLQTCGESRTISPPHRQYST
ncbi:hypothetical protein FB567DRAFT_539156 [Paraphoma chrysanthemicola]|uniref:Secreted protein n=1 Tax=Paraphoma chrysanthemicola TaxID=798071 RepID=A0A8K0QVJ6_9PLEO|nr:hypothetical protein FB567DRAFT_539156 [Paraphoma chrysanthemicola]